MTLISHSSIQAVLGREIPEEVLTIAKCAVGGMIPERIAELLGATVDEIKELQETQDYKDVRLLVGVEHAKTSVSKDFTWDSIEATALESLSNRVGLERDTEMLLRIAAVANKAQRRMTQKEEHVLDPASALARVPLRLTKRFTEKLNSDGSSERSETQEISVINGTARMPSFESINKIFNVHGSPIEPKRESIPVMDEVERFLQGIPKD